MNSTSQITNRRERTRHSRPVAKICGCGRPTVRYVTSEGIKNAPYCGECSFGPKEA